MSDIHRWGAVGASVFLLHCGSAGTDQTELTGVAAGVHGSGTLQVNEQTAASISGRFSSAGQEIEFSARGTAPLAGDVQVRMGPLSYDVHYDYAARSVRTDGHGGALDRPALRSLGGAIDGLLEYLGPSQPGSALHEQMLT